MRALLLTLLLAPAAAGGAENIGIRPDCSEQKTSVEELKKIALRSETILDFLRALPEGSLQTFTFVKGTSSFQHHLTSASWPRVLRASADAKIALSFVCNPASQDYGRVEILHYLEPPVAEWRSLSLDFRTKKLSALGVSETEAFPGRGRVHEGNPVCAKCHSLDGKNATSLLPVLPQYKTWNGFFGSDDDVIHKGMEEEKEFKSFLAHTKTDPCFSTLPWPKGNNPAYALYPFHEGFSEEKLLSGKYSIEEETKQIKVRNYHLRPNLKLTDALSHLMAQRLAWRFLRSAEYRRVAPLLMMEAANCGAEEVASKLEQSLPGYHTPAPHYRHTFMDPRSEMSWTKQLFALGQRLGFSSREWTMHFNDPADPYYNTGAAGDEGRDISIGKMAQGVLLKHLAETYPELKPGFRVARSVSKFFAPQDFSCIDDIAGQIAIDDKPKQARLCERLAGIASEGTARYVKLELPVEEPPGPAANESTIATEALLAKLALGIGPVKTNQVKRGRKLVQENCSGCHGNSKVLPPAYQFLAGEASFEEQLRKLPGFLWTAIAYVESGRMPKGQKLNESERRAILLYLLERAQGK